jgi:hypothetical protein
MRYVHTISWQTVNNKRYFSDKIMTLYKKVGNAYLDSHNLLMGRLGDQTICSIVLILCVEYVTSRRYSAAGVGGWMSGLRS